MVPALAWISGLALPVFPVAVAGLAGMTALFGWILHFALGYAGLPVWLALPVTWTGMEWTLGHLPDALAYPWLGLGTSLTAFPTLVGFAEVVGVRGVTFWIALANGLLAAALLSSRAGRSMRPALVTWLAVVGLPAVWGAWRSHTLPTEVAARVAVVQPNVPADAGRDGDGGARESTWAALDRLLPTVAPGSVDLVVLPEGVLDADPARGGPEVDQLQAYSREIGAPILFGAPGETTEAAPFNSAFLMEPQGLTEYRYDKHHLVPVVERMPLARAPAFPGLPRSGLYASGDGWPLARVDETSYGTLICYESSFPAAARSFRRAGADVLVNITNDGWYGRGPLARRTTALWQHPAHLVMRAIEHRVGVVRAANTGISMFVDPLGRIYEATPTFEEEVRVAEVRTSLETTPYTRYGDVVGALSALTSAILLAAMLVPTWWGPRPWRRLDPPRRGV